MLFRSLKGLNPNPQTTSLVGNPWRVRKNIWIPIISGVEIIDTVTTKQLSIEFIAIVNPELVEYINVSPSNPLPIDVEAKIAGTPNTGECFQLYQTTGANSFNIGLTESIKWNTVASGGKCFVLQKTRLTVPSF